MSSAYPFADGDPLETPYRYAYVVADEQLVAAWAGHRSAVLEALADAPVSPPAPTWLDPLRQRVLAEEPESLAEVDRLLRRFEVSKRVFDRDDVGGRPAADADDRHLPSYVGFGRLLVAAHSVSGGGLTYLNGLIKALDVLCANTEELGPADRRGLAHLLAAEHAAIAALGGRVPV